MRLGTDGVLCATLSGIHRLRFRLLECDDPDGEGATPSTVAPVRQLLWKFGKHAPQGKRGRTGGNYRSELGISPAVAGNGRRQIDGDGVVIASRTPPTLRLGRVK